MTDVRTQLPECPLEYQVPYIPGSHTALALQVTETGIDWQEKMLPWTLASLINNTDLVMKGVHLYVVCEPGTETRIETALKKIELPRVDRNPILIKDSEDTHPLIRFGKHGHAYDSVCMFDMNYWAFRGIGKAQGQDFKLPLGHALRHNYSWGAADYSLHPANDILLKDHWVKMSELQLTDTERDRGKDAEKIAIFLTDVGQRGRWLHDANRAVYGEDYEQKNQNVARFFFNEPPEPNWHLNASLLQYQTFEVNRPDFIDWAEKWKHLGTEPLIALWLLKTQQHAYNLRDSLMMEHGYARKEYPQLCFMKFSTTEAFRFAIKQLLGAQLSLTV